MLVDCAFGGGEEGAPVGKAGQVVGHGETLDRALAFENFADRVDHRKGDDERDDGGDFRRDAQRVEIPRALSERAAQAVRTTAQTTETPVITSDATSTSPRLLT